MAKLHRRDGDPGGDRRELPDDGGDELRWFCFVRHENRGAFEAQGWVFAADLGPVHGCYSVLMEAHQHVASALFPSPAHQMSLLPAIVLSCFGRVIRASKL